LPLQRPNPAGKPAGLGFSVQDGFQSTITLPYWRAFPCLLFEGEIAHFSQGLDQAFLSLSRSLLSDSLSKSLSSISLIIPNF
jgi:hypothetical protein